ncbi:hypothetical protein KC331_g7952 [Hortaea werneckii]|nr:hypothetical protein KC331_g7952 [Hortaea werneckii]KAI7716864.1 hypothetical protein KC353_g5051 [Hortaea werneckii]
MSPAQPEEGSPVPTLSQPSVITIVKQTLTPPKTDVQSAVPVYNCVLMRTITAVTVAMVGSEYDGDVRDV